MPPITDETPFLTIAALVREHAQERPGDAALRDDAQTLNWRELDALMDRVAAALQRDSVRPGDAIGICAASSVRCAALYLGALRAGVVVAPLAPSVTRESLAQMLDDAQAQRVFADSAARELLPGQASVVWLDGSAAPGFDLLAFQMKFCTSAPFRADLKADVLARWPGGLVEFYGMTEGGGTCILNAHEHPDKLHTVGQPAPGHDIRLIDEDGRELPPGSTGEVVGRSGAMMAGYHHQPEKTREVEWFDASGQRFIRTGDVGRFDEDGFLVLMDRRKDMIISGGFNLYPSDLEALLRQHPAVDDAAVVGVASAQWGETPVAFVVRRAGDATDEAALIAWHNERSGKTQRLAALQFIDELPRSAIGKVLKRELRERLNTPVR